MLGAGDAEEVAARFGLGGGAVLLGPVARGQLGRVWRLETDGGTWAVKEPLREDFVDDHEDVAAFQEAAHAAGVPVPAVVRTLDGSPFADVGSVRVRAYAWVQLLEPDIHLDPEAVGALVAALHRVDYAGRASTNPWYSEPVGPDAWDALVEELRAGGAPFADDLRGLRDGLVALEGWLAPPRTLRTCHRDLWADNLLATAEGGLCVVDWDNAGLADPSQELAGVVFEYGAGDPARARAVHDAYVAAGGPGRVRSRGDFTMTIAQFGHLIVHDARCWLDADDDATRAEHEERFAYNLTHPFNPRVIDDLLDAIAPA